MRLGNTYLQSIVYLGWPGDADHELAVEGTGFFVAHDDAHYIVTAAHVAKALDAPFAIRLNRWSDGGGQNIPIESANWHYHPTDDTVDIAVLPLKAPSWAQSWAFKTGGVLTDFKRETKKIKPGDLAYVVGAFRFLPGDKKNNPIVHTGHLASWAEGEGIPVTDWRTRKKDAPAVKIRGHLVQVQTLRQSSGSPVFVRRGIEFRLPDPDATPAATEDGIEIPLLRSWCYGSVWLLGIWHGAWTHDEAERFGWEIPVGTGVAVPATQMLEVLDKPELVAMRGEQKRRAEVAATDTPSETAKN